MTKQDPAVSVMIVITLNGKKPTKGAKTKDWPSGLVEPINIELIPYP
jgi:hypothetical protein